MAGGGDVKKTHSSGEREAPTASLMLQMEGRAAATHEKEEWGQALLPQPSLQWFRGKLRQGALTIQA